MLFLIAVVTWDLAFKTSEHVYIYSSVYYVTVSIVIKHVICGMYVVVYGNNVCFADTLAGNVCIPCDCHGDVHDILGPMFLHPSARKTTVHRFHTVW